MTSKMTPDADHREGCDGMRNIWRRDFVVIYIYIELLQFDSSVRGLTFLGGQRLSRGSGLTRDFWSDLHHNYVL